MGDEVRAQPGHQPDDVPGGRVRLGGPLSLEIPRLWHLKESITALAPDGRANVIASTEPLEPGFDALKYASVQGDMLVAEFDGYHGLRVSRGW